MIKKIIIFIPVLLFVAFFGYWVIRVITYNDEKILNGYIDHYDCHMDIGMDYNTYREYYYEIKDDEKFIDNADYIIVDDNIDEIKSFFDYLKKEFKQDKKCRADIKSSVVSNGDYMILTRPDRYYEELKSGCRENNSICTAEHDFKLYYYDIDTHTLYYLASKT